MLLLWSLLLLLLFPTPEILGLDCDAKAATGGGLLQHAKHSWAAPALTWKLICRWFLSTCMCNYVHNVCIIYIYVYGYAWMNLPTKTGLVILGMLTRGTGYWPRAIYTLPYRCTHIHKSFEGRYLREFLSEQLWEISPTSNTTHMKKHTFRNTHLQSFAYLRLYFLTGDSGDSLARKEHKCLSSLISTSNSISIRVF